MRFLHLVIAVALLVPASAAEYHVATSGSDQNPGSKAKPFRTIQKAADVARWGDTCIVHDGIYRETVRPARSGHKSQPIRFVAAQAHKAIVSGADPITGWRKMDKAIYAANAKLELGKNNQVFFDGTMVPEARWPNDADGEPLTPDGARISKGGDWGLISEAFPDSLADDAWNGAVVWVLAGAKWTSFTARVADYRATEKKLLFAIPDPAWIRQHMNPQRGGQFILRGKQFALDGPNEWFYDHEARRLHLWAPGDADPNRHTVAAKARRLAFDLSGLDHIHVEGFAVHAATVNMADAHHCVVKNIRAAWISHTRGGHSGAALGEESGIRISGSHNTLRDSEIAFSVGNGVELKGADNRVVNCWIHDTDYIGCYGSPISIEGVRHLVSHNTIHDTGRDGILLRGQGHVVQFNHVFRAGRIASDLGLLYTVANDGGNTEIHHNWLHDNRASGLGLGIYLDNFTSNTIVHHNVVWNAQDALRLNRPSTCNLAINNTLIGFIRHWGRWEDDRMVGVRVVNNLLTQRIQKHADVTVSHNRTSVPEGELDGDRFRAKVRRQGLDKGTIVPGIADDYEGEAPDIGAYEFGREPWKPGHNFADPPEPVYIPCSTPLRNRILNGSFELFRHVALPGNDVLSPWRKTHRMGARLVRGRGGIQTHPNERRSRTGHSVGFDKNGDDGIEQTVTGLEPATKYILAGFLRVADAREVRLGVKGYGGKDLTLAARSKTWKFAPIRFTTGETATSATVTLFKPALGEAFADDICLVPAPQKKAEESK